MILAYYAFVVYLLIFKTNKILNFFKLDKGFNEDTFSFQLPLASILTIALITIGGIELIDEIPNLCRALYQYIQLRSIYRYTDQQPNFSYAVMTGVKIILGLLIIGERKRIVTFIAQRQKEDHQSSVAE